MLNFSLSYHFTQKQLLRIVSASFISLGVMIGICQYFFYSCRPQPVTQQLSVNLVPVTNLSPVQIDPDEQIKFWQTLTAHGVYVMDVESGMTLLAKNPDKRFYPASTAKLMTALVARQQYSLDEVVEVNRQAFSTGQSVGLGLGERFSIESILQAMLISSGNDAAFLLADHHPFGYDGFVLNMNSLAQDLHLASASFANPSIKGSRSTASWPK